MVVKTFVSGALLALAVAATFVLPVHAQGPAGRAAAEAATRALSESRPRSGRDVASDGLPFKAELSRLGLEHQESFAVPSPTRRLSMDDWRSMCSELTNSSGRSGAPDDVNAVREFDKFIRRESHRYSSGLYESSDVQSKTWQMLRNLCNKNKGPRTDVERYVATIVFSANSRLYDANKKYLSEMFIDDYDVYVCSDQHDTTHELLCLHGLQSLTQRQRNWLGNKAKLTDDEALELLGPDAFDEFKRRSRPQLNEAEQARVRQRGADLVGKLKNSKEPR
jgi:hypothetical protein